MQCQRLEDAMGRIEHRAALRPIIGRVKLHVLRASERLQRGYEPTDDALVFLEEDPAG
jgi:hypothetical protein